MKLSTIMAALTTLCSVTASPVMAQSTPASTPSLDAIFHSATDQERIYAFEAFVRQYRKEGDGERSLIQQQSEVKIIEALEAPIAPNEKWSAMYTERNMAVELAGELKLMAATPLLIELLGPRDGQLYRDNRFSAFDERTAENQMIAPAALALIEIGVSAKPAVEAAVVLSREKFEQAFKTPKSPEYRARLLRWSNAKYVLEKLNIKSDNYGPKSGPRLGR